MENRQECGASKARSRRRGGRIEAEEAVRMAKFLCEPERRLVEQVFRHGLPIAGIAAVAGTRPGVLHRRLEKVCKRMNTVEFRVVSEVWELFPTKYQSVARLRFLQGYSLERVAQATELTVHQVRQRLCAIDALIRVGRQLMAASAVRGLGDAAQAGRLERVSLGGSRNINGD